ncbi:Cofilin [Lachnellula subtilissima]|uniref:Cofilin n=1 Tax=Lachnellula subtilissima TaxID=602034 RepID=A0A8H8RDC3_9HELO|nr:Cofilin [Lachnellula subtilissima]
MVISIRVSATRLVFSQALDSQLTPMTSNKLGRDRKADKDIHLNRCSISPDCVSKFNELKLNKKIKYIIYKLTDDYKEIVVEETSEDGDWETFRQSWLPHNRRARLYGKVGKGPRYAVYDFNYDLASGEGSRSKITFIAWSPDDAGIQPKMVYASSKDALKRALNGIATEFQANDEDDIEYQSVLAKVSKGLA